MILALQIGIENSLSGAIYMLLSTELFDVAMGRKVSEDTDDGETKPDRRGYPMQDVKLLYSRVMGGCCFPGCTNTCIEEDLATEKAVNSGQIAHIEGVAENSMRYNSELTKSERDSYKNWILMCGLHHPKIDATNARAVSTYTTETIRGWKNEVESRLVRQTQKTMPDLSSAELEVVTKFLLKNSGTPVTTAGDFQLTDVRTKINKNKLSGYVSSLLEVGIAKAPEVSNYLKQMESFDSGFTEQLRLGFVQKYLEFHERGYSQDSLFECLREYACQNSRDPHRQAAGLAVLSYFFELCEVFEK